MLNISIVVSVMPKSVASSVVPDNPDGLTDLPSDYKACCELVNSEHISVKTF